MTRPGSWAGHAALFPPAVHGIKWTCSNGSSTADFSVEQLVQQILESHQAKPPPRTHACLCSSSLGQRPRPPFPSEGSPGHPTC